MEATDYRGRETNCFARAVQDARPFFRYPDEPLNPRLISRHTGTDIRGVVRELKKVEETGVGTSNATAIRQNVGEVEKGVAPARMSSQGRSETTPVKRFVLRHQAMPSV
jgi:hypothetical protein